MNKQDFYKELKNIGVDTSNPEQMKVWSLALLAFGQDFINHKTDRCKNCYYEDKAMVNGKFQLDACINQFCPVKQVPDSPAQVVDFLFDRNIPLDMGAFYHKYVDPILKRLIEKEEEQQNAGQHNSGNNQTR